MARDTEPMTEEELEAAREGIRQAFAEARADVGIDLDEEPVPDGGED